MKEVKENGGLRRIYRYRDVATGAEVLMQLAGHEEPHDIGEVVTTRAGRKLERLPSGDGGRQHEVCVKFDGLFKNYQIDRKDPIARHADGYDKRGTPMFKGRSQARDYASRMRDVGMDVEFDG
jgi:hypothetical protein